MRDNAEAIRAIAGGRVPASMMEKLPRLEIIANSGVGVDTIDMPAARSRGIAVTNTPDVLNDSVAELAVGLMLALARAIPQADRFVREGKWRQGPFRMGRELRGKTVGILGLGRIGKEIATRLSAMKMTVAYCGRTRQDDQPYDYFADPVALASHVDWLVVAAPGGKGTAKIVSAEVLAALGPQGMFVNVARGSLVDQDALIAALRAGTLGGAALDVFVGEPEVPAELLAMDNVVMMPHQGGFTVEAREAVDWMVFENLLAHFGNRPLLSPVP
jgi:lactate dehydrogenase-like 2-hydroxyacid dehydrogenase